jgi:plasmid maintenance system antidote protein VapI
MKAKPTTNYILVHLILMSRMSYEELAQQLGVHKARVTRWVHGYHERLSTKLTISIARVLAKELDIDYVLRRE